MSRGPDHEGETRSESPQARIEREEFARGHIPPGGEPVEPRPAATIVLARPGRNARTERSHAERAGDFGAFEVLLLERPGTSRFAAGAFVFPGGAIDPADAADAEADDGRLPPLPLRERAALVAAIRELFEETGILLGHPPPEPGPALERAREDLLSDRRSLLDVARELEVSFAASRVAYFARWITPSRLTRRYDTRFFFALAGSDAEPRLTPEHVSALWIPPAEALARFRAGELPMLFPTWKTLDRLAAFPSLAAALEGLRAAEVEEMTPRLEVEGDAVRPLLPGDPGYDEAG